MENCLGARLTVIPAAVPTWKILGTTAMLIGSEAYYGLGRFKDAKNTASIPPGMMASIPNSSKDRIRVEVNYRKGLEPNLQEALEYLSMVS